MRCDAGLCFVEKSSFSSEREDQVQSQLRLAFMVRITGIRLINFGALRSIIGTNIPIQAIPYNAIKMNELIQDILFLNDHIPRKMVKPNPRKASIKNVKRMSFICSIFFGSDRHRANLRPA
jgi:hypothetical protein